MRVTSRFLARASTLFVALATAGAVTCVAGPVAGATPAQPVASGVSTHALTGAAATRAAAIANYWTPQRMLHAISADALVPATSAPTGEAGGSGSGPAATLARPHAAPTNRPQAAPTNRLQSTALNLSTAQGKVFFHNPMDGYDYVCSGGTVNNPTKDMVFTAGHCVYNGGGGGWMTNWAFVPAYYNGSAPYGYWYANYMTTFNGWINNADYNYDVGVVNVASNGGNLLVNQVGGNGLNYNYGYSVTLTVWGYPASDGYDGQTPYYCYNLPTYQYGSRIKIGCSMTHGASGGSWLRAYDTGSGLGYVNGVTSTAASPAGYIASPYFDDKIGTIYGSTQNL